MQDIHPVPLAEALALPPRLAERMAEFFTAQIRNSNTRKAYWHACRAFAEWMGGRGLTIQRASPVLVATYIETLAKQHSAPTVKQHLAALRMLFDWLVLGQVLPSNPATSVRGPKHIVKQGKTPVLEAHEVRSLLDSLPGRDLRELRDRALIAVMLYSFARVGAVLAMQVEDFYWQGGRRCFRLHEKGGKRHEVPAHPEAAALVEDWLRAASLTAKPKEPLFQGIINKKGDLSAQRLNAKSALTIIKQRSAKAGIQAQVCCHSLRASGITIYMANGGSLERAQQIAGHESPRTTKLYDRNNAALSIEEIERIRL